MLVGVEEQDEVGPRRIVHQPVLADAVPGRQLPQNGQVGIYIGLK